jgi:glycosyltransferase involved in cell wall biosynthesis
MKGFIEKVNNLRIIQCQGHVNAAIARNAGLKYITRRYVFFVDGDVELYQEFIENALERIKSGKADAVTGKLLEIQYTSDYSIEIRRLTRRKHITREQPCLMTGGILLTTKEIVGRIGEWDASFWRLQDFDYTLRISRIGTLLQLPQIMGVHHTQEYHDRSWEHFKKGYPLLYGRLLRNNLNSNALRMLIRANRGLATFLIILFANIIIWLGVYLNLLTLLFALCFIITIIFIDFLYSFLFKKNIFTQWLLHNYFEPPMILFGFMLKSKEYYPVTKTKIVL